MLYGEFIGRCFHGPCLQPVGGAGLFLYCRTGFLCHTGIGTSRVFEHGAYWPFVVGLRIRGHGNRHLGVFISIDDFGTDYSSLSYLRQLPAQQLKIDRSFVRDVTTSPSARAVVQAVIHLAHALGLSVVAEGVETAAQRDILRSMRCDELQGFFFAQPMDAAALLSWAKAAAPACKEQLPLPAMGLPWGCAPQMRLR